MNASTNRMVAVGREPSGLRHRMACAIPLETSRLLYCWLALVICQTQMASGVQQVERLTGRHANAEFRWHGGDNLAGELISLTDGVASIQSRFFADPIELERSVLESVRFIWPAQELMKSNAEYELVFRDGSTLHTDIERIREGEIWIKDPRFGQVRIPVQQCASIFPLGSVEYEWAGELADWRNIEAEGKLEASKWLVNESGDLVSTTENAKLWLPMQLNESFVVSIRFAEKTKPDFMISTGLDAEASLRVGTIGENLIIGTADDFEIAGDASFGPMSIQLVWNSVTKELSLRSSDGTLLATTREKGASDKSGILIHNQGARLTIPAMRITRGMASVASSTSPNTLFPTVSFANGERIELQSVQLEAGKWSYSGIDGKMVHPIAELIALHLNPFQRMDASNANARSTNIIRWRDGSFLQAERLTIDDGVLKVRMNESMPTMNCSLTSIDRILFAGKNVLGTSKDTLKIGSNQLTGQLQFGNAMNPLLWRCEGQMQPNTITSKVLLEITLERGAKPKDLTHGFRDILYFSNGDVVPCSLCKMNTTTTTGSTPFGGQAVIQNACLSGVELNANGSKLRHSFTKESREMMLTMPRASEASMTTHVLLGSNGDLLRGSVIALSDATVELDSKQEPMLIERDRVLAIAYLAEPGNKDEPGKDESVKDKIVKNIDQPVTPELFPELAMRLRGGYRLTARFVRVVDQQVYCQSESLGECGIPIEQIEAIAILKPNFGSDLSPYSVWATQLATAPRWSSGQQSAVAPSSMLGKKVADFQMSALDGSTFKLSEYAGRVVVLDFWATWCGPCVASLPEYLEVMREFAPTDAVFLGVNSTETPDVVRSFIERKQLVGFNSLFDFDQSLMNEIGVGGIPHTVVIGPSGEVAHVHVGYTVGAAKEVAQIVRQLLQK